MGFAVSKVLATYLEVRTCSVSYDGERVISPKDVGAGISASVTILRDKYGVPTVSGEKMTDVYFGLGVAVAQDRLFQMDTFRRLALGTLSELSGPGIGDELVEVDKSVRTLGFGRLAEGDAEILDPVVRSCLQGFCDGVNWYIDSLPGLPPEYLLVRAKNIRKWTVVDTVAFNRILEFGLSLGLFSKLTRALLAQHVGEEAVRELEDGMNCPGFEDCLSLPGELASAVCEALETIVAPSHGVSVTGSNAWACGPDRSPDGSAIGCGDPHLLLFVPGFFCEWTLIAKENNFHCAGAGAAGLPFILIGHNNFIFWSCTLPWADVEDIVLEKVDIDRLEYLCDGKWKKLKVIDEVIKCQGRKPIHHQVLVTRHGPLLNNTLKQSKAYGKLSVGEISPAVSPISSPRVSSCGDVDDGPQLRNVHTAITFTTASMIPKSLNPEAFFGLLTCSTLDEFRHSLSKIRAPPLVFTFATKDNDFGFQMTGSVPEREVPGMEIYPREGFLAPSPFLSRDTPIDEYDPLDDLVPIQFIPFEKLPRALNPQRGYVMHTNNRISSPGTEPYIGNSFIFGWRAQRIEKFILEKGVLTLQDHCDLQSDVVTESHGPILKVFSTILDRCPACATQHGKCMSPAVHKIYRSLVGFSGNMDEDTNRPVLIEVIRHYCAKHLLIDVLGETIWQAARGAGDKMLRAMSNWYQREMLYIPRILLLGLENKSFFARRAGGSIAVCEKAVGEAIGELTKVLGNDMKKWRWADYHSYFFISAIGEAYPSITGPIFNLPSRPSVGCSQTVGCATSTLEDHSKCSIGAVVRYVCPAQDWNKSMAINAAGQGGNPFQHSKTYGDQYEIYVKGGHRPFPFDLEEIEKIAVHRMTLKPK